jgi:hypothetical protein
LCAKYINSIIKLCEEELNLLSAVISVLMPIQLAVDAPCSKEADPLTAEAAIKLMMENVGKENLGTAREMQMTLKLRILKRRTIYTEFCWGTFRLIKHLEDPGVDMSIILR